MIIVDNLDRLPPEDAMTVWSTVRSIFLGANGDRVVGQMPDLPTIVMPLDQNAREIYKPKEGAAALAQSFIDKTFDVVFHVPKPVLSKRHAYLSERLKAVFGKGVTDTAAHAVGSVYERHLSSAAPSPRAINSFVARLHRVARAGKAEIVVLLQIEKDQGVAHRSGVNAGSQHRGHAHLPATVRTPPVRRRPRPFSGSRRSFPSAGPGSVQADRRGSPRGFPAQRPRDEPHRRTRRYRRSGTPD